MKVQTMAVLAAVLLAAGCGGTDEPKAAPAVNVSGTWAGSLTSHGVGTFPVTLTLSQTGAGVTGTYNVSTGVAGAVEGTVSGTNLSFVVTFTNTLCPARLIGGAEVAGTDDQMTVAFNQFSTCGGAESGDADLARQ